MANIEEDKHEDHIKTEDLCLFYSNLTSLQDTFRDYKWLKTLVVIGQNVDSLEGVELLCSLEELWVVDANLQQESVGSLNECLGLRSLYLYGNDLTAVPDLGQLRHLNHLWLADNQIDSLQNINNLSAVEEVNLGNNKIHKIDVRLRHTLKIECFNLSGNPISNIKEIALLSPLGNLRRLLVSDPLYARTPVSLLANFRPYVIHCLPRLESLDLVPITSADRQNNTTFYETKLQYYRVALHKVCADLRTADVTNWDVDRKELEGIRAALHVHGPQKNKPAEERNNNLEFWKGEADRWKERKILSQQHYRKSTKVARQMIQLELEYSGNLRFEELSFSNRSKFKDKLDSFICPRLKRNVTEVNVLNVWVIHGAPELTILQSQVQDHVYILSPVTDLDIQPLELVEHLLFGNQLTRGVSVANCLMLADPLVSDNAVIHRHLLLRSHSLLGCRLALLCGVQEVDLTTDQVSLCPHHSTDCRLSPIPDLAALVPLHLVLFQYSFQDYFKTLKVTPTLANRGEQLTIPSTQNLTKLVLHDANLHDLESVPVMEHVTKVDLSYNHLQDLSAVTTIFPKLISLNLAFNKVNSLESLQIPKTLTHLVMKWNSLTDFLAALKKLQESSSLKQLDLRWNPFKDVVLSKHQQVLVCRHLGCLQLYDGLPLQRSLVSGQVTLKGQDQFPMVPGWRGIQEPLTLRWKSELSGSSAEGNHLGVVNNQIVSVTLRELQLTQFRSAFSLSKLKWLDMSDNLVSGASTVKHLSTLEEVNLSHNVVESFACPSERFKLLTKLDLSHNYIASLVTFSSQSFPRLKLLDLSNNYIQCLAGLAGLKTLVELYLSHNMLEDCESLATCKPWRDLKVIDLSYNPLASSNTFRQNCLYYMPGLQYINGSRVQAGEVRSAALLYGGLLDEDYLARVYSNYTLANLTHLSLTNCSLKK